MSRGRELLRYASTRLALAPVMLWLISTLVFLLLRVAPGDPVDAVLGSRAPEDVKAELRAQLGLDQSLGKQYLDFLRDLVHGDLGRSLIDENPVTAIIGRALPASLELSVTALVVAAVVGLAVGFTAIARSEGGLDLAGRFYGIGTYALPPFWVAMLAQLLFAVMLGWLPASWTGGSGAAKFLLPVIAVFAEQHPGGLLGVIQLGGTACLFPEDIIDIFEGLFEHLFP